MVIRPRDAAVQMLQWNTDLVRHEVGKARVGASKNRSLWSLWQYARKGSVNNIRTMTATPQQIRTQNVYKRGKI